jgi:BASS family bile acid:Na+ symporter
MKSFLNIYGKVLALMLMMVLGVLLPQFHTLSFLVQYLLMVMLFFAFLGIEFKPQSFQIGGLWILAANVTIAFIGFWLLSFIDLNLALAAFMTGIAPTAIAAPVIVSFIEGKVEYAVGVLLLTNVSSAVIVPFTLPYLLGKNVRVSVWEVLGPVLVVMFVPLILSRLVLLLPSQAQGLIRKGKPYSFPIWLINLFLISAKAADFLRSEFSGSITTLITIALISLAICVLNFGVGALIGGRYYWQEASQSLGQKNNSFVIWIALTFINPLVAMGPTFYILYHHLYNSWQIYRFEKRRNNVQYTLTGE